ncbi:hypothetical protein NON20_21020 [Synechocystis sp. B12]|nr:hypothetical protein NON20_21020 [Synechocystis sp. B12]
MMKRIILALLTVISLVPFLLSLVGSLEEPQVQSQLQLSQTNLLLQASAWQGKENREHGGKPCKQPYWKVNPNREG